MKNEDISENELRLIDDLEKFSTFRVVTKIDFYLKAGKIHGVDDVYNAPSTWSAWRKRELQYNPSIFGNLAIYNECGISTAELKAIFGKTTTDDGRRTNRPYKRLLEHSRCTVGKHGKAFSAGEGQNQVHYFTHAVLPQKELVEKILADGELLAKIKDWNSEYYTPRQRRLIKNHGVVDNQGEAVVKKMKKAAKPKIAKNIPQENEIMTKAEKENLKLECEKGLHGLDYDTLVKDIEKKERRQKKTQQKRIEKIVDAKIRMSKYDETEYIHLREQLEKLQARVDELQAENDELKAQLAEEESLAEKPVSDEQVEKNFQECLETCEKFKDKLSNVPEEDLEEVETAHEQYVQANAAMAKKLIQSAFSHGVISRENARMYAKLMFQDTYYKFQGTDQYCAQTMLLKDNVAMRAEYLNLVNELWKIVKSNYGTQFYDDETNRWIKGRLNVAKTYLKMMAV